jgi:hypothetical protein
MIMIARGVEGPPLPDSPPGMHKHRVMCGCARPAAIEGDSGQAPASRGWAPHDQDVGVVNLRQRALSEFLRPAPQAFAPARSNLVLYRGHGFPHRGVHRGAVVAMSRALSFAAICGMTERILTGWRAASSMFAWAVCRRGKGCS